MDELVRAAFTPVYEAISELPPSLQLVLVVVVIIITQGPKMLAFRARWDDYRRNRRELQYEKERLEVIKLHYEIEAVKKNNDLSTDAYEAGLVQDKQAGELGIEHPRLPNPYLKLKAHIEKKRLWKWVERNPRFGKVIVDLMYVFIWILAYLFAFATVSVLLVSFSVDEFRAEAGAGTLVYSIAVYVVLTAVFFYWKAVFAHRRKLISQIASAK